MFCLSVLIQELICYIVKQCSAAISEILVQHLLRSAYFLRDQLEDAK